MAADRDPLEFGPAPAGPAMCFPCVTGTCHHSPDVLRSSVHGGGLVPAVTYLRGTALCLDCASESAHRAQAPAAKMRAGELGGGTYALDPTKIP